MTKQQQEPEVEVTENGDGTATVSFGGETEIETEVETGEGTSAVEEPGKGAQERTPTEEEDEDAPRARTPEEDEELAAADTDEEREKIRDRRRQERADKKLRAREREASQRRENAELKRVNQDLMERVALIERRTTTSEIGQIDAGITQATSAAEHWKQVIAHATKAGDGAAVADATEKMILSRQRAEQLTGLKNQFVRDTTTRSNQGAAAPDMTVVRQAQAWQGRNPWYDPSKGDVDSRIVATLDSAIAQEGYDPRTPEYWEELDRRVKDYLPHKQKGGTVAATTPSSQRKPPRTPVSGSGREAAAGGARATTFRLSAERVQALKEAGMWDDPKSRADMIKRYHDADRSAAAEARSTKR